MVVKDEAPVGKKESLTLLLALPAASTFTVSSAVLVNFKVVAAKTADAKNKNTKQKIGTKKNIFFLILLAIKL